ncbi:phosphoserine phosphatase [Sporolactobacillus sp. THM7-7]|nr:phosphoserine phosphatase [Sporolactobacillus sp. THM7-7]
MDDDKRLKAYKIMLAHYMTQKEERALYNGKQISKKMIEQNISPEEVVGMHIDVLNRLVPNLDEPVQASLQFLMDVMVGYGVAYREHQILRDRQKQLDSEIEIAADVQQSLLEGTVPDYPFADVGAISEPAKKMTGDYFQFVRGHNDLLGVAVADIVGKGIPAAMSMSMIKYAMDSLPESSQTPPVVLSSLNRVVHRNVDPSMFVTMFYGVYDPGKEIFSFASAGHEPGFYYMAETDRFEDLETRGFALGFSPKAKYKEYKRKVAPGDMIILLTDGVTEVRTNKGFAGRKLTVNLIRKYMLLPAQKLVENVFYDLQRIQNFEMHDDFTFIAMKF